MQGRLAENSVGGCIQRVQARGFHRAGWHDVYEIGGVDLEPRVAGKRGCLPSEQLGSTCPTNDCGPVVMSESSTATSVSDRSLYPNLVRLSSSEDTVSQGVIAVADYYGWKRIAVVYDAADSWAADASRILSENLRTAGGEPLGNKCVSSYCTRLPEAGTEAELTGIRFDEDGGLTADLADKFSTN